jgi:AbrB family looped-hinge helix DNA binding protein
METSLVDVKGQFVVPTTIRRELGIKKGAKISFVEQRGKLIIQPLNKSYFESLAGILGTEGKLLRSLMKEKKNKQPSKCLGEV